MNTQLHILLVEDDEVDVEFVQRALRPASHACCLTVAANGQEALELLKSRSSQSPPGPCLILLDLHMPVMTGLEFLRALRNDPVLHQCIVFILTTSNLDVDRQAAYAHHAAGYILKSQLTENPRKLLDLLEAYRKLVEFPAWPEPA